tara:strand:+ start:15899 stop:21199 length:5301 start_codon:yes stop_codon:yes gene_type:complete
MAESKNTFIQSKMNKDLDGRILPNGQYRDGQNVQISRSEGDDVGALENVLGNLVLTDFGLTNQNLESIGYYIDDTTNTIFSLLTDYTDTSADKLSHPIAGASTGECYIVSYNVKNQTFKILVEGNFLNFSKTHFVTGINLIEGLLFWSDNRNQPRKINVNLATPGYYTHEDHVSVAKYYPYTAPLLLNETTRNSDALNWKGAWLSSMKDVTSEYLPIHAAAKVQSIDAAPGVFKIDGEYFNVRPSSGGLSNGDKITGATIPSDGNIIVDQVVMDVNAAPTPWTQIYASPSASIPDLEVGDIVYFQRQNPLYDRNWSGDKNYLKDKFVRFSYRFKFDDNEYSLIAPFTQIAFVPEQDGYFIGSNAVENTVVVGQEGEAFDSTVVRFMQNKINDIGVTLVAPTQGNDYEPILFSELAEKFHVTEIDIIYAEASSPKLTVVDTLTIDDFGLVNDQYYTYEYKSRKPWKTLPENEVTRNGDIVPVRSLAQESSGNRLIYGNYIDKHTSPLHLDYEVFVSEKAELPTPSESYTDLGQDPNNYVRMEYQNHTLKQNRTYQAGVRLADRYGRSSDIILSNIESNDGTKGSTFYHDYKSAEDPMLLDKFGTYDGDPWICPTPEKPETWPGDMLNILFKNIIPKQGPQGYPGIYSEANGSVCGLLNVETITPFSTPCAGPISMTALTKSGAPGITVSFEVDASGNVDASTIVITTTDPEWNYNNGDTVFFSYTALDPFPYPCGAGEWKANVVTCPYNPLGWHSYHIVVKQTEQEYYNVYLPGALAGYPCNQNGTWQDESTDNTVFANPTLNFPQKTANSTSHIVLFGDNINKVPRDLQEVGPLDEKFRSSVVLYQRVNPLIWLANGSIKSYTNEQVDPGQEWDLAVQIGRMNDLKLGDTVTNPVAPTVPAIFYQAETNPKIAKVETFRKFGIELGPGNLNGSCNETPDDSGDYGPGNEYRGWPSGPGLAIYETKPVESKLDLYWETSTSGLVNELNYLILNEDNTIGTQLSNTNITFREGDDFNQPISSSFYVENDQGLSLELQYTIDLISVFDLANNDRQSLFKMENPAQGVYEIWTKDWPINQGVASDADSNKNTFTFEFLLTRNSDGTTTTVYETGELFNDVPEEKNYPTRDIIKDLVRSYNTGGYTAGESATNVLTTTYGLLTAGSRSNSNAFPQGPFLAAQCEERDCEDTSECEEWTFYIDRSRMQPAFGPLWWWYRPIDQTANIGAPVNGSVTTPWKRSGKGGIAIYKELNTDPDASTPTWKGGVDFGNQPRWLDTFQAQKIPDSTDWPCWYAGSYEYTYSPYTNVDIGFTYTDPAGYNNFNPKVPAYGAGGCDATYLTNTGPRTDNSDGLRWELEDPVPFANYGYRQPGTTPRHCFKTVNGSFDNGTWPRSQFTGQDIVYEIVRMYQVSMFLECDFGGYGGLDEDLWEKDNWKAARENCTDPNWGVERGPVEYVFGLNTPANILEKYPNIENYYYPGFLDTLPTNPIYWDANPDQLDPNEGGEAYVGYRYNQTTNGSHHYWADLDMVRDWIATTEPGYNDNDPTTWPEFMKLIDGANTFYQMFPQGSGYSVGSSLPYATTLNAAGFGQWLGGIDADGLGARGSKRKFFALQSGDTFWNGNQALPPTNVNEPKIGTIHAGDFSSEVQGWGIDEYNQPGNGVPGGRYVVTLRATDRSTITPSNPVGKYIEYDMPIQIQGWEVYNYCCIECENPNFPETRAHLDNPVNSACCCGNFNNEIPEKGRQNYCCRPTIDENGTSIIGYKDNWFKC